MGNGPLETHHHSYPTNKDIPRVIFVAKFGDY
jgi:hypothetical protein